MQGERRALLMQRPWSMTTLCKEEKFWARRVMFVALKFVVKAEHVKAEHVRGCFD